MINTAKYVITSYSIHYTKLYEKLSAEDMSQVEHLRAEGEALHKAGKHQESIDTLAKAMKILGI